MSQTVVSSVNLADPEGGIGLPAGVPVTVDDTDEFVKSVIDGQYLVPVTVASGDTPPPEWDPGDTESVGEAPAPTQPPDQQVGEGGVTAESAPKTSRSTSKPASAK